MVAYTYRIYKYKKDKIMGEGAIYTFTSCSVGHYTLIKAWEDDVDDRCRIGRLRYLLHVLRKRLPR